MTALAFELGAFSTVRKIKQLLTPTPDERQPVASLDLWRLYWLHRGRLAAPFVGDLQPVPKSSAAECCTIPGAISPRSVTVSGRCAAVDVPAPGCGCGFRAADNMLALAGCADAMVNRPELCVPIVNRMTVEQAEMDEFDWPVPALVRVRAENVLADDMIARLHDWLWNTRQGKAALTSHLASSDEPMPIVWESFGTYRAQRVTITGPILTGPVDYAEPDPRDVAEHYQAQFLNVADITDGVAFFGTAMQLVDDQTLPSEFLEPPTGGDHSPKVTERPMWHDQTT